MALTGMTLITKAWTVVTPWGMVHIKLLNYAGCRLRSGNQSNVRCIIKLLCRGALSSER